MHRSRHVYNIHDFELVPITELIKRDNGASVIKDFVSQCKQAENQGDDGVYYFDDYLYFLDQHSLDPDFKALILSNFTEGIFSIMIDKRRLEPVGCCFLEQSKTVSRPTGFGYDYIMEPYRRQGLGSVLLIFRMQQAKELGVKKFLLSINQDNHGSMSRAYRLLWAGLAKIVKEAEGYLNLSVDPTLDSEEFLKAMTDRRVFYGGTYTNFDQSLDAPLP